MTEFPIFMYSKGGPHQCKGGDYSYVSAGDLEAARAAASAGCYHTPELAITKPDNYSIDDHVTVDNTLVSVEPTNSASDELDESPPTRPELEAKARDLGISFTATTKDETLLRKVADALES